MKKIKVIRIIFINFIIFLILIFLFEIFFGYWFSKNNFGHIMRFERQKQILYETVHDLKNVNFFIKETFMDLEVMKLIQKI